MSAAASGYCRNASITKGLFGLYVGVGRQRIGILGRSGRGIGLYRYRDPGASKTTRWSVPQTEFLFQLG